MFHTKIHLISLDSPQPQPSIYPHIAVQNRPNKTPFISFHFNSLQIISIHCNSFHFISRHFKSFQFRSIHFRAGKCPVPGLRPHFVRGTRRGRQEPGAPVSRSLPPAPRHHRGLPPFRRSRGPHAHARYVQQRGGDVEAVRRAT